uniref:Uncharacterized protein n=1 Tax=Stomoxys calcitrans TaxID=35570 RepID=A0A1I8NXS6_STOCA
MSTNEPPTLAGSGMLQRGSRRKMKLKREGGLCIINVFLLGTTATMLATIALGSITTLSALPAVLASADASAPSSSTSSHRPGNYQGVDAVSALTGLSNGYMASYYHQLRNAGEHQHQRQNQQPHYRLAHAMQTMIHNPEVVDKEPNGRGGSGGLQHGHASHYGNGLGGNAAAAAAATATAPSPNEALENFNVPDSGFIPTTLSAAGQHYASSLLDLQSVTDKNNVHVHGASASALAAGKLDLQQSTAMAGNANNGPASLYGRLSNYDEAQLLSAGRSGLSGSGSAGSNPALASPHGNGHNFAEAYDNYAANLYHDPSSTNEGEQLQNFANYFTPTSTASTSNAAAYGPGISVAQSPHKYLPLNNYHNTEQHSPQQQQQQQYAAASHHYQQQKQQQQQADKQNIYSRAATSLSAAGAGSEPESEHGITTSQFFGNYNYPNNVEDNKHLAMANYQIWNMVDKQLANANYYESQSQQQTQQTSAELDYPSNSQAAKQHQHQHQLQRHFQQDEQEESNSDYKEPEAAESSFILRTREKRGRGKSKRSEPITTSYEDSYSQQNLHTPHSLGHNDDNAETIQVQQQQLDELHQQLRDQQQQFMALQHQLIDHDQRLQIHHTQASYHTPQNPTPPTLPPITQTVHHNQHSLQALNGTPLSKHTHIIRNVPIIQRQAVYVPTKQNVNVEVPDPVITTVAKPLPIEIPVSKTIAIPQLNEVKIPIERIKPFPVERPIPYLVEKRVPYTVEKQIAQPVYYHVPIKVPIVHTVVHKLHSPHAYSYQHQKQHHLPIHYTGHIRHPVHHHGGHGHLHYSSGHYLK